MSKHTFFINHFIYKRHFSLIYSLFSYFRVAHLDKLSEQEDEVGE